MTQSSMPSEAKVGLFALAMGIMFVMVAMRVGQYGEINQIYTDYTARLPEAHSLQVDSHVELEGVRVGKVLDIASDPHEGVIITLRIFGEPRLHQGAEIGLRSSGLLGSRYMYVTRGDNATPLLQNGDMIENVGTAADLEQIMGKVNTAVDDLGVTIKGLRNVFGDSIVQDDLKEVARSIRAASQHLETILADFSVASGPVSEDLVPMMEDLRVTSSNLREVIERANQWSDPLTRDVDARLVEVSNMLRQVEEAAREISDVVDEAQTGDGTIATLLNDEELASDIKESMHGIRSTLGSFTSLRTYIGYRGEFQFQDMPQSRSHLHFKHWFTLDVMPNDTMWYTAQVISDPIGAVDTKLVTRTYFDDAGNPVSASTYEEVVNEDRLLFSLWLNRRFWDISFRLGLMENHGGWGVSYHAARDTLGFHFDAYHFGRENNWPILRGRIEYRFLRYLRLSASVSDFANRNGKPIWSAGGGFYFDDLDLKSLLLAAPSVSTD